MAKNRKQSVKFLIRMDGRRARGLKFVTFKYKSDKPFISRSKTVDIILYGLNRIFGRFIRLVVGQ